MPPVYPPITIDPPQIERALGGLYAAANFPDLPGEGDRWENGIQYQAETCATSTGWAATCGDDPARVTKEATLELPLVLGTPFVEYLGIKCAIVGQTLENFERLVRNALDACEQRSVESTFWTGDMGNDPHLADPSSVILGASDVTPLSILRGVSLLERYLGDNYCGVGVFHAPRDVAPYADNASLIHGTNPRLTTALGTRWAFGAGYSVNTGPDGTEADPGTAWIYATGQVNIWRSDIWMQPDALVQAFSRLTNDAELFAERNFVLTSECTTAAVLVNLDCDC
jgi:hypothetical protein